ncbi:MAG: glycosyltransferase family 4 protein [Desulfobacterales bacterium]|nr:glycosyltransferase family 4 protein [Desulfobacterales bacterium]
MKNVTVLVLSFMYPNFVRKNMGVFIHNQVKALKDSGCNVVVIAPVPWRPRLLRWRKKWQIYKKISQREWVDGIDVFHPRYFRPRGGNWVYCWEGMAMYMGIKRVIKEVSKIYDFDLIHANRIIPDGYAGILLGKKFRVPVVSVARGSDTYEVPFKNRLNYIAARNVLKESDQLAAVSGQLARIMTSIGRPKSQIKVVHNACDTNRFRYMGGRNLIREKVGLSQRRLVILFVGTIHKKKGIYELLDAFNNLRDHNKHIFLVLIGEGKSTSQLKVTIEKRGLQNCVKLTGYIPNDRMQLWYNSADIFVLPTYHEGTPNVVVEAMACELPVVATDVGGIPEILSDGKTGIIVKPRDASGLANALDRLINDAKLRRMLGKNGRRFVEEELTWETNASELIKVYESVM